MMRCLLKCLKSVTPAYLRVGNGDKLLAVFTSTFVFDIFKCVKKKRETGFKTNGNNNSDVYFWKMVTDMIESM